MHTKKTTRSCLGWLLAAALLAPFALSPGAPALALGEPAPLPIEDEWLPVGGVSPIEVVAVYEEEAPDVPPVTAAPPDIQGVYTGSTVPGGTRYGYDWISDPDNTGADAAALAGLYEIFMTAAEAAYKSTATFEPLTGMAGYVQNGPVDVSSLSLPYSTDKTDPATVATQSLIDLAVSAFTNDNPQFYMCAGAHRLSFSSVVTTITPGIYADYATYAARQEANAKIEAKYKEYEELVAGADLTDYDIIRLVHDKMLAERDYSYIHITAGTTIGNTQYTGTGYYADPFASAHNILGVMDTDTNGPVCEGFTEAFSYILHRLGVGDAITVVGMSKSGGGDGSGGHAWNLVKIDGSYYYVDSTWDNRDNTFPSSNNYDDGNTINDLYYKYFLVGANNTDFGAGYDENAIHWAAGTTEVPDNKFALYGLPANISASDYIPPSGTYSYLTDNGYHGKTLTSGTATTADDYNYYIGKSNTLTGTAEENPVFVGGYFYPGPFNVGEFPVGTTPNIPLYKWAYNNTEQYINTMFTNSTPLTQGTDYTVTAEPGDAGDTVRAWLTGTGAYRGIDFVLIDLLPPTHYTVTFDPNGGTVTPTTAETGPDYKLTELPTPTRDGYAFDGWYTEATGGTKVEVSRVYGADTTIYAHWTPLPTYTVTFNPNGGTVNTPSAKTGTDGKLTSLPTPARTGYTFDSWYTEATGGDKVTTAQVYTKDTIIYAQWTALPTYTITFNAQGGTVSPTSAKTGTDGKLTTLPTPTRTGYAFKGWYTTATGNTKVEVSRVYTTNTTIYAQWTEESGTGYTVTFDARGGAVNPTSGTTGENGKLTTLPTPTRNGYLFDGWYTEADGGAQVTVSRTYAADTTVYAHWTKLTPPKGVGVEVMVIVKTSPSVQVTIAIFLNGTAIYQGTFPK